MKAIYFELYTNRQYSEDTLSRMTALESNTEDCHDAHHSRVWIFPPFTWPSCNDYIVVCSIPIARMTHVNTRSILLHDHARYCDENGR